MGITIFSDSQISVPISVRLATCDVCMLMSNPKYSNDIERIFAVLNEAQAKGKDLTVIDESMCAAHGKKIRGLKIFSSQDELFELDNTSSRKQDPQAMAISEDEYNKIPELINTTGESDGETGMQDVSQLLF